MPAFAVMKANGLDLVEYVEPSSEPGRAAPAATNIDAIQSVTGAAYGPQEVEPNNSPATATPLVGSMLQVTGNVFPAADIDFYSFTASAGDRVYAATQTLFDASASGDSTLQVIGTDGTTVLEADNNDGTFNASSASIAGTLIPAAGTYFLRVAHNVGTGTIRPYHLHFRLQSAAPAAEVEPNNTPATATPIPASGHVSGTIAAVAPGESDFYSIALAAGDTVFLSLDMNPERDASVWNGRLGLGLFGNPPANQILLANDANAGAVASDPNSEAFFFTVKDAGTYFVYVDSIVATGLGANATYNLSVSVLPRPAPTGMCTTYTSTDIPQTIPTGPGSVSSTITVPGNPRIADLDVAINLNHTFMQDIDAHLVSPAGNDNGLFTDIGAATVGGAQTLMDIVLDDEAGLPPAFAMSASFHIQPELAYRLSWFDGIDAGGTWTLVLRDDATGDGGTLNAWSITICEPPPPPSCPAGTVEQVAYSSDFEASDGGFTHGGVQDEWERGLPSFTPITTCNSGVNCWKTDLDNTYNASSNQDLLSPSIDLTGLQPPVLVRWAQRYHLESATFDRYSVEAREVGGANPVRLFEWLDATMNNTVGSPGDTVAESSGWSQMLRRVDSLAGTMAEINFNLTSDSSLNFAGAAIDDVSVTACRPLSADLSITKTNGTATSVPGTNTVYTITASNAGADPVTGASVADTFPAACTSVSWTCVGAGGGSCPANGSGNLAASVDLPANGSATFTATCAISPAATGTLDNTATVSSSISDPAPGNNSANDTDTLTPQANLSITLAGTPDPVNAGGNLTYDVVVTNGGPSVADAVQASLPLPAGTTFVSVNPGMGGNCTTPAVGANGTVTCTWAGATAPAGSRSASIVAAVGGAAVGPLSATATASSATFDPDAGNNSAMASTAVIVTADVSLTLTASPAEVAPGLPITFTAIATNNGPGSAQDIQVNLALGAGVAFASANAGAGGVCSTPAFGSGGSVICTWAGATAPGAARTLVVTAYSYTRGAAGASATASSSTNDPTPANNAAAAGSVIVGTGAGVPPPAFIPTASTYGLAFLAVLLGLLGFAAVRRQH